MPFLRFDILEGRTEGEITALLDAAHQAMLEAFHVHPRDRYQIVHEHRRSHVRLEDTGLGIGRSGKTLLVSVTTRPRTVAEKTAFYRLLCKQLHEKCGVSPSDVIVNIVENADADWSFGNGEAQFLTGKVKTAGAPQRAGG